MGKHKRRKKDEKQTELGGKEKGETNKGEKERKRMERIFCMRLRKGLEGSRT